MAKDNIIVVNVLGVAESNGTHRLVYYNLQGGSSASISVPTDETTTPATLLASINTALTNLVLAEFPGSQVALAGWATSNPQVLAQRAERGGIA